MKEPKYKTESFVDFYDKNQIISGQIFAIKKGFFKYKYLIRYTNHVHDHDFGCSYSHKEAKWFSEGKILRVLK